MTSAGCQEHQNQRLSDVRYCAAQYCAAHYCRGDYRPAIRRSTVRAVPCHPRHVSEEVAELSVWRADRNARQARFLDDAVEAAMDALYEWSRSDEKVRAIIIATSGNPRAADADLPVAARLTHAQGGEPLDGEERRWFAVALLRVVAPELYDQIQLGLVMSDVVEELDRAAEAGDAGATELLSRMRDIIGRAGQRPAG